MIIKPTIYITSFTKCFGHKKILMNIIKNLFNRTRGNANIQDYEAITLYTILRIGCFENFQVISPFATLSFQMSSAYGKGLSLAAAYVVH